MKNLILITLIALLFGANQAKAEVCITETYVNSSYSTWSELEQEIQMDLYYAAMTCQELDRINTGMQVVSIGFATAGIYAACTGVGLPATVALEGGSLAFTAIALIVSQLPCDDLHTELQIKEKVDEAVCNTLKAQGLECLPPLPNNQEIFSI